MQNTWKCLLLTSVAAALFSAGSANAQDNGAAGDAHVGLETIVVTATKRATNLQTTPIAITAVTGAQLKQAQINDLRDLPLLTPGLVVNANSGQENPIALRGISSAIQGIGGDSPVAIYLDGVYIGRPHAALFQFPDIKRIEVARGPQGTLSGRNSTAGAIDIITVAPSDEFSASARVGYGSNDEFSAQGTLNVPISNDLFFRASVGHRQTEGYQRLASTGKHVNNEDNTVVDAALRYVPNDRLTIDLRADYSRTLLPTYARFFSPAIPKYGLSSCPIDCDIAYSNNTNSKQSVEGGGVGLTVQYDLGFAQLKSISAYRHSVDATFSDNDLTDYQLSRFQTRNPSDQYSQEFTFSSEGSGPFSWVGGLYYYHESAASNYAIQLFQTDTRSLVISGLAKINTNSYAAYANLNYALTDALTVSAGARYSRETKDFTRIGGVGIDNTVSSGTIEPRPTLLPQYDLSRTFTYVDPRADIQYKLTPDNFLYASISRGSKSGGFSFSAQGTADPSFKPEKLTAYEVGSKNMFLRRQLRFNMDGFYYDYTDLQETLTPRPGVRSIYNAASATVKGLEFEMAFKPDAVPGLELTANASILDTNFDKFFVDLSGLGPLGAAGQCAGGTLSAALVCDFSGNKLPRAPNFQGTFTAQYEFSVGDGYSVRPSAQLSYSGRSYYTQNNSKIAGSARPSMLLDAQIGFGKEDDSWRLTVWGRNLTDRRFISAAIIQNLGPSAVTGTPFPHGVVGYFGFVNAPRSYGVELSLRY